MKPPTLSKSGFRLALECPTKVFYSLDRRYVNTNDEDEFRQALADGGFQVGELAKRMYAAEVPAAVEITALYRTLRTTNVIENLNCPIAHFTRNVKRWKDGQVGRVCFRRGRRAAGG